MYVKLPRFTSSKPENRDAAIGVVLTVRLLVRVILDENYIERSSDIPQKLRERFGLLPNAEVEFVATPDGKELRLLKSSKPSGRGRALIERVRGRGTGKRSTDELLKLMRSDVS
jgi:bifunctional DNA-binding transcriptional regulator/antitoxin component of YhaV-PrlF toxin-antitoxin module